MSRIWCNKAWTCCTINDWRWKIVWKITKILWNFKPLRVVISLQWMEKSPAVDAFRKQPIFTDQSAVSLRNTRSRRPHACLAWRHGLTSSAVDKDTIIILYLHIILMAVDFNPGMQTLLCICAYFIPSSNRLRVKTIMINIWNELV